MTAEKRGRGRPANPETLALRAAKQVLEQAQQPPAKEGVISRVVKSIKNRYDAAGMGRRLAGWMPRSTSPNTALANISLLRERSRDATRNDWSATSGVQKWSTALIGIGITPRFKRITSASRKAAITDLFAEFVAQADADCVLNLYGLQTLAVRTWFDGGECFVRRRNRFLDEELPVPLQVQLLESDMLPFFDTDARDGLPVGNIIRSGIELNKRGKRVAYWFFKNHPGENALGYTGNGDDLVRVLARDVCHVFEPKRPGQLRGVSELAAILARLRNMSDFDDAVLERQKIANLFVIFIKRMQGALGVDRDPLDDSPVEDDEGMPRAPLAGLQPGLIQELDDGQEAQFANPPEAGTTYSDYMRTQNVGTAAGMGLPYELHSGDIINVSDRTLRILINEFRRLAEQRQWQIVIPLMCQPIVNWFVESAVLVGKIDLDEADNARRVEHAPHGWPDIHPTQDIEGRIKAVEAGHRSRSSVIAAGGDDPEAVDKERAEDRAREQKLNLLPPEQKATKTPEPVPGE